jgi:hypothetical protein
MGLVGLAARDLALGRGRRHLVRPKTPRLTIRPATSSSMVGTIARAPAQECPRGVGKIAIGTPAAASTAANLAI